MFSIKSVCDGKPKYLHDETKNLRQGNGRTEHRQKQLAGKVELYYKANNNKIINVNVILAQVLGRMWLKKNEDFHLLPEYGWRKQKFQISHTPRGVPIQTSH